MHPPALCFILPPFLSPLSDHGIQCQWLLIQLKQKYFTSNTSKDSLSVMPSSLPLGKQYLFLHLY
jgi:hypothetical protein